MNRPAKYRIAAAGLGLILVAGGAALIHRLWPGPSSKVLLRQAIAAIDEKDDSRAALLLDQILDREPKNCRALLYRGQAAHNLGDAPGAEKFWAAVPDSHPPEAATARFSQGQQALAAHRARDAERLFRRSTELHPQYEAPRLRLIFLYNLQMRDADLRSELAAIRAERPWTLDELTFSTGYMGTVFDWPSQVTELEKFIAADHGDVNSILALAECLLASEKVDQAVELLERSLARQTSNQALRGTLADALLRNQNPDRARQVLGNETRPGETSVHLARAYGAFYTAGGDWDQAAAWLDRAAELDPDHRPTLFHLGQALERTGHHDDAKRILHRARLLELLLSERGRFLSAVRPRIWQFSPSDGHSAADTPDAEGTEFLEQLALEIARLLVNLERSFEASAWLEQVLVWRPADSRARAQYAEALNRARRELADSAAGTLRLQTGAAAPLAAPLPLLRIEQPRSAEGRAAIRLVDRHSQAGVEFQYRNGATGSRYILETLGGGVAAFDFDGDGWPDLYFSQGCPLPVNPQNEPSWRDRLFQNVEGTFRDVTEAAGLGDAQYSHGTSAGDFDNDGFEDLAVANFGTCVLYRNNGDGTLTDVSTAAGISGSAWHSSLAFADLDRDGYLDLYVVTYVREPYLACHPENGQVRTCSPQNFSAEPDRLFRNQGDGRFEDVSASSGIAVDDGKGLGVIVADLDNDGWPEIYVANDTTPNFLFRNLARQTGAPLRFEDRGLASGSGVSGAGLSQAGMGIACGDLDGDGLLDLLVTNYYLESATFYRNQGELLFIDDTRAARLDVLTRQFLGFGTQAVDFDLDGRLDLFIANGHVDDFRHVGQPWKMAPQVFSNQGTATFVDASRDAGPYFQGEYLGRSAARLDWNRDGRPDLVVVHLDQPAALLRNETAVVGNRLILELHGVKSNRDAIGARATITCGGSTQVHEICGGDGYFASNERRLILGLGSARTVDRLEIRWPQGGKDQWFDIPAESSLVLIEGRPPLIRALTPA
ncbi:MAG: VCBS repeat-containing protein, partial [Planctomycetia bacterium]|nr:VCBS repeat-containing protein [Planctomycetia bacterium]